VLGIRESKGLEFKRACIFGFFESYVPRSADHREKPLNGWKTVLLDAVHEDLRGRALNESLPWQMEYELKLLYTAVTRCRSLLFLAEPSGDKGSSAVATARRWLTADGRAHSLAKLATLSELHEIHASCQGSSEKDILEVAASLAEAAEEVIANSGLDGHDEHGRNPKSLFDDAFRMFERADTKRGRDMAKRVEAVLNVYSEVSALHTEMNKALQMTAPTLQCTARVLGPRGSPLVGQFVQVDSLGRQAGQYNASYVGGQVTLDKADLQACIKDRTLEERVAKVARLAWQAGMPKVVEDMLQRGALFDDPVPAWDGNASRFSAWASRVDERRLYLEGMLRDLLSDCHAQGVRMAPYTSSVSPGLELRVSAQ